MKKLIMIFSVISVISCKEKLPSNIESAVWWNNTQVESLNKVDSIIIKLEDIDIEKLSPDSAFSLYASHTNSEESYNKAKKELDELLKFNAEYSNYDEVKNIKYHFLVENRMEWEKGYGLISKNVDKLYERYYKNR